MKNGKKVKRNLGTKERLKVHVLQDSICIGRRFSVNFQRTLRIPDDGNTYPLPPGLGRFPIFEVEDYQDRVPETWAKHGGVFIPMYQREALWLCFDGAYWKPNAVKVAAGKINAVTGKPWSEKLNRKEQDYMVIPTQPWLDGFNVGEGYIRQFIAMPLGMGYTVEGQLTGKEEFGGLQIIVFEPKPGKFPDSPPQREFSMSPVVCYDMAIDYFMPCEMGLGAGGKMKQKIYPDEHGLDTWDEGNHGRAYVHIVNSMMFREITGMEPPPTPVSARTYTEYGLPWFDLYDEDKGDLAPSDKLAGVKTVKEMDKEKGFGPLQDDSPVDVPKKQVKKLKTEDSSVKDGDW